MNELHPSTKAGRNTAAQPNGGVLKPYLKPAFRHEQVFETMALACGKVGTAGACATKKKFS